jgi:hypothetical protein
MVKEIVLDNSASYFYAGKNYYFTSELRKIIPKYVPDLDCWKDLKNK